MRATRTAQQLSYDAEGRLSHWQNAPGGSPTATASFRYDGEGERVAQQSTSSGTTTTTRYLLGGLEELTTVGSTSTLTKYFGVPGVVTAIKLGTPLSYLATDGLGSVSVALNTSGSATGQALYLPYGQGRYASGSLPTARGYTGQYQDSTSGLDYYGARYYDPTLGQFTSADTVLAGGLNRYAYVHGNPTTATDPGGHHAAVCEGATCDGGPNFQGGPTGGPAGGSFGGGGGGGGDYSGDGGGGDSGDGAGPVTPWTSPDLLNAAPGIEGDETGDYINQGIHNDAANGPRTLDFTAEEGSGAGSNFVNTGSLSGDGELTAGDTAGGSSGDPGSSTGTGTGTGSGTGGGDGSGSGSGTPSTPSSGGNGGTPDPSLQGAENVRNANANANGEPPGAGAVIVQDGADPIAGYSGEDFENPGFNLKNHPFNGRCAEVACSAKAVNAIKAGQGGWQTGKPARIYISQARLRSPCVGCSDVLYQLASYLGAPVTAYWLGASGEMAAPFVPGLFEFGE